MSEIMSLTKRVQTQGEVLCLSKKENGGLGASVYRCNLTWNSDKDLDIHAMLVGEDGKARGMKDFVAFTLGQTPEGLNNGKNPKYPDNFIIHESGAVVHSPDVTDGSVNTNSEDEFIEIDLKMLAEKAPWCKKVIITAGVFNEADDVPQLTLDMCGKAIVEIKADGNKELFEIVSNYVGDDTSIVCEFEKVERNGITDWRINPVKKPIDQGIETSGLLKYVKQHMPLTTIVNRG